MLYYITVLYYINSVALLYHCTLQIRCLQALAFAPVNMVQPAFEELTATTNGWPDRATAIADYFRDNYVGNGLIFCLLSYHLHVFNQIKSFIIVALVRFEACNEFTWPISTSLHPCSSAKSRSSGKPLETLFDLTGPRDLNLRPPAP